MTKLRLPSHTRFAAPPRADAGGGGGGGGSAGGGSAGGAAGGGAGGAAAPVPTAFASPAHYVDVFEPLIHEEARCTLRNQWDEGLAWGGGRGGAYPQPQGWRVVASGRSQQPGGWFSATLTAAGGEGGGRRGGGRGGGGGGGEGGGGAYPQRLRSDTVVVLSRVPAGPHGGYGGGEGGELEARGGGGGVPRQQVRPWRVYRVSHAFVPLWVASMTLEVQFLLELGVVRRRRSCWRRRRWCATATSRSGTP